jgi:hypothetical protein
MLCAMAHLLLFLFITLNYRMGKFDNYNYIQW